MRTLLLHHSKTCNQSKTFRQKAFTLLELLVVLVVISIATGLIVIRGTPGDSRYLENQAEKLSQILRVAHQHALMKSRELRFITSSEGYLFEEFNDGRWGPVEKEPLLRARVWEPEDIKAYLVDDGRNVPYLTIGPKPGLNRQEVVIQLNRTVMSIRSATGGRFKTEKPRTLVEGDTAFQGGG